MTETTIEHETTGTFADLGLAEPLLEALPEATLFEDRQRQRAYWVWLGEFLHPHANATRFPTTARAFALPKG